MNFSFDAHGRPIRAGSFVTLIKDLSLHQGISIQAGSRLGPVLINEEGLVYIESYYQKEHLLRDRIALPPHCFENILSPGKVLNEENLFMSALPLLVEERELACLEKRKIGGIVRFEAFTQSEKHQKINQTDYVVYLDKHRIGNLSLDVLDRHEQSGWTILKFAGVLLASES